jgi:hypothetical protein
MRALTSALFLAGLLLGAPTAARAGGATTCNLRALDRLVKPSVDTSVELELEMAPELLQALTTTDGRVGGLLQGGEALPDAFLAWARAKHPKEPDPRRIKWTEVSQAWQLKLLRHVSRARNQDFSRDRAFHGLKVRDRVRLTFKEPTRFLGKKYPRGAHWVDVSKVMGAVEYGNRFVTRTVHDLELHFRWNQSSGQVSNEAWAFLEALGIPRDHQHVHVVAPLPVKALREDPVVHPVLMADFARRVDLASTMALVVQDGRAVRERKRIRGTLFFDQRKPKFLAGIWKYFAAVANGEHKRIGRLFRMAMVGLWGSDKYDGQTRLWGLEFRGIGAGADALTHRQILDGVQARMNNGSYGMTREEMARWLEAMGGGDPGAMLERSWYNQEWPALLERAPAELRKKLDAVADAFPRRPLLRVVRNHRELKLLAYDWSMDPLVYNHPALRDRIRQAQLRALDRILATETLGGEEINTFVSDFLVDSGLYAAVMKSVGVEVRLRDADGNPIAAWEDTGPRVAPLTPPKLPHATPGEAEARLEAKIQEYRAERASRGIGPERIQAEVEERLRKARSSCEAR